MNISYNWLKDFVDVDLPPARLAELITSRAATVDAVEALRDDLRQFVVARVVECAPHPDSDHLSVTKVDAGTGELLDVVCGAPNVRAGKLYPFAKTGTKMPAGFMPTTVIAPMMWGRKVPRSPRAPEASSRFQANHRRGGASAPWCG